jgi:hypothetical protein
VRVRVRVHVCMRVRVVHVCVFECKFWLEDQEQ